MNLARDWMILHALFFILLIAEGAFGKVFLFDLFS